MQKGQDVIDLTPSRWGFEEPLGRARRLSGRSSNFTYALAEGATGEFFDHEVTLANPGCERATVAVDFLPERRPAVLTTKR